MVDGRAVVPAAVVVSVAVVVALVVVVANERNSLLNILSQ